MKSSKNPNRTKLSETLLERGYVYQHTGENLKEVVDETPRTFYWGVDPSGDSMQVGQLMGILVLRRFVEAGHKLIMLVGGGTGMIGDPSGKSAERSFLSDDLVARNAEALRTQLSRFLGGVDFEMVNNAEWLYKVNLMEFLRDIGKNFTINEMVKRDNIRPRLETPDASISYTEFTYSLLQAYDFLHLHNEKKCDLQVGGSDQWGNIVSGVDLIRRKTGDVAHAFTWPLLVDKKTGKKFGKSESGTVWLDEKKTSISDFYQFWFNADDSSVRELLFKMTLLSKSDIDATLVEHVKDVSKRHAQRVLARAVTEFVHGAEGLRIAEGSKNTLFVKAADEITADDVAMLEGNSLSKVAIGTSLVDALVTSKLASSKREARQFLVDGAITLNGVKVTDRVLAKTDFKNGNAILKRGKRNVVVLTLE